MTRGTAPSIAPPPPGSTPIALTIAGSDSGGGAGIQADLRVFARHGVFGTAVITAITAQNTLGVAAWEPVSTALVLAQLDAVLSDLPPRALKTGMLATAETVAAVAAVLRERAPDVPRVIDPVMVASSGNTLAREGVAAAIRDDLIRGAALVTPNLGEAAALLDASIRSLSEQRAAARALVDDLGARAALVKGSHFAGDTIVDVLYDGEWTELAHDRIASRDTHGTGCTLSAAITAMLACGEPLRESVVHAVAYVQRGIRAAPGLGAPAGHGPLEHMV